MKKSTLIGLAVLIVLTSCGQLKNSNTIKREEMEPRVYFTSFLYFNEDGQEKFQEFQKMSTDLFEKYDLHIEHALNILKKGEIGEDKNTIEQPDRINIFSLPSMEAFQKMAADPEYQQLAKIRDAGLLKFSATLNGNNNISSSLKIGSNTPIQNRMYALAFINFKEYGKEGLMEFNKQGIEKGLYEKYGMHLEMIITPKMSKAIIGELDYETPEMIFVFYLDDITKMPAYLADPIYNELAPLRDDGLKSYHFFMGKKLE
jgi:uncharacterized protein (DUF1330 family)